MLRFPEPVPGAGRSPALPPGGRARPCTALPQANFVSFNILNRHGGNVTASDAAGHASSSTFKNILGSAVGITRK